MERLFGIPMGALAVVLVVVVGAALGALAALALRNRVFLRLALRNVSRRRARTALIVLGLMLGTTIVSSALATGDTMSHTVRSVVQRSLGNTDELVSVRSAEKRQVGGVEHLTRISYFDQRLARPAERALRRTGLVDGIAPAISEPVSVQDVTSRQNEPRVRLFASDPARMGAFGEIEAEGGGSVSLAALRRGEIYLNVDAADELAARQGDLVRVLVGARAVPLRVGAIVRYDGTGTDGAAALLPLRRAQELFGRRGQIQHLLVSNSGGDPVGNSDAVVASSRAALAPLGLEIEPVKQESLETADQTGDVFMSVFTTFGSFSIMAGILLIFLIFVMLAAERRAELGISRAVGTRRGHLVQMFVFEGVAYDLGAAAVGAALGVAVAYGMVTVMANAFSASEFEVVRQFRPRSLVVAYTLGVLLTLVVVAVSAWRVSRLNIVSAVRNMPEPPAERTGRRRIVTAALAILVGAALFAAGLGSAQATPLSLGFSVAVIGLVGLARVAGVPDRIAYTVGGLTLVIWWLLPASVLNSLAGEELNWDFSIWVVSGVMLVAGSTWLIVYNADLLLGLAMRVLGRIRALAPMLKMAMAYPLRGRFRTGVTLAMFTLVVFTVVVGATTSTAFLHATDNVEEFGGGFDVRGEVAPTSPLGNPAAAIRRAPGLDPRDFEVAASGSFVPADARQLGTRKYESYPLRGFDNRFLASNSYGLAAMAKGYTSPRQVWGAMARRPGLAVVDALTVPRHANWGFAPPPPFRLHGFYLEDERFNPVRVSVRDPQTGRRVGLTVIGVLKDTAPLEMAGIWTSQRTAREAFGARAVPTIYFFKLAPGVDPGATAHALERTFLANGMEAKSMSKLLHEAVGASYTLNWLLLGFMGLGLIVGVAALGVISARAVVERRQQIGVLRSIGFRRRMVEMSFLLESSFIALTAIVVGTALGLAIAYNVIHESAQKASWTNLSFEVPWVHLGIVFFAVYAAALLTSLAPAIRAARVYPAEALRYE
ncbi:MAG TPA: FtsX-like permease family protein [Solirubrobacterales bacterium]|nr:FtsX-like permease family protein [Solirubrobacterales bacterium]